MMIKHRLLYIFSFLSLSIYAETLPIPGSALAVPGSLSGLPFAAPSALFSNEDTRSSAFNPAAAADRNLPLLGLATSLAFPTASGIGGSGLGGPSVPRLPFPRPWRQLGSARSQHW
ncbi:hypothetical protein MASR2M78_15970 [Treponema sp.]